MRDLPFPWFTTPCLKEFKFLIEKYDFNEPKIEQLGREQFITYTKYKNTISIAYELGAQPVVECFYPNKDIKNRFFPRSSKNDFNPKKFNDQNQKHMEKFLKMWANFLEENELGFLLGEAHQKTT